MSEAIENGIFTALAGGAVKAVKRSRATGRAKRAYGKELKASRKLSAARKRRQAAERVVMNPSRPRRPRRSRGVLSQNLLGGASVGDAVGVGVGIGASLAVVKIVPLGASGSFAEIVGQMLIAVGLYFCAPESVRRGAACGALVPPVVSLMGRVALDAAARQNAQPSQAGAGLSGLVDFNGFNALTSPEAAGAASTPATVFNYEGGRYS